MFCHDFEKIAGDLAAGHLMEAGKRERALRHASECPACALRLKAERTLEAGLLALGEGADDREAPPHLKTALRAAFDRQVKTPTGAPVAPVAPIAPVSTSVLARQRDSARRWVAAAAAVILIAAGVALMSRTAPPNQKAEISIAEKPAQQEQAPQPVTESVDQGLKTETDVAEKKSSGRRAHRRAANFAPNFDDMALNNESVTDYIPLTYLADATAVESGMVLRVELPPSALITMGLQAPVERTDSPVKADLIVGDDGVARAVRFVGQDLVRR
ncbi:MAG TPA: hypothetical protein VI479_12330 [Blastocatellia bacterium]